MRFNNLLSLAVLLSVASLTMMQINEQNAYAMPFNTDMFEVQPSADAVSRKKPEGSVAIGSLERQKPDLNSEWVQKNPYQADMSSVARGERKFQSNCSPCHGKFKDGVHQPSAILSKGMPSVDLSSELVKFSDPGTNKNPKPDAHYFTYIYNGGALMPAYGYKLGNNDIWDLVSYIRFLQNKK